MIFTLNKKSKASHGSAHPAPVLALGRQEVPLVAGGSCTGNSPHPAPETVGEEQSQVRRFLSENIDPQEENEFCGAGLGVSADLPKGSVSNNN